MFSGEVIAALTMSLSFSIDFVWESFTELKIMDKILHDNPSLFSRFHSVALFIIAYLGLMVIPRQNLQIIWVHNINAVCVNLCLLSPSLCLTTSVLICLKQKMVK